MAKELYIEEQLIDLEPGVKVPTTYSNADIRDMSGFSTKSNRTHTFKVPATKKNKNIFGFPEEVILESFDATVEKKARLESNGTIILNGIARIKQTLKNGVFTHYSIILIDGNGSWITKLKGKRLTDLDFSEFDHPYTKASIDASETVFDGSMFLYPLVNYGKPKGGLTKWLVEDRIPWLRVLLITKKIFSNIGFDITGFVNEDFYKGLFISPKDAPKVAESTIEDNKFRVGLSNNVAAGFRVLTPGLLKLLPLDTQINSGTNIFFNTKNVDVDFGTLGLSPKYTNQLTIRQSFTWDYEFFKTNTGSLPRLATPESSVDLGLFVNGVVKLSKRVILPGIGFNEFDISLKGTWTTDSIELKPNDIIEFKALTFDGLIDSSRSFLTIFNENAFGNIVQNTVFDTIIKNSTVEINALLPDETQLDFISDFKELFNWYFFTDEINKTIRIESRDQFYDNEAVDWSDKQDLSKGVVIKHMGENLNKKIRFKYKRDSKDKHIINKEEEFHFGDDLASIEVDILNVAAKDGILEKQLKIFSPTWVGNGIIGAPSGQIPVMWDTDDNTMPDGIRTDYNTRLMFYNGVRPLETGESWNFDGQNRINYPQLVMQFDDLINNNSLYFENGQFALGLNQKHWANTIETINKGRIEEHFFSLTEADIQNLDFRKPIFLSDLGHNTFYHILSINNYDSDDINSVSVDLVRLVTKIPIVKVEEFKGGLNTQISENPQQPTGDNNFMFYSLPTIVDFPSGQAFRDVFQDLWIDEIVVSGGQVVSTGRLIKVRYEEE